MPTPASQQSKAGHGAMGFGTKREVPPTSPDTDKPLEMQAPRHLRLLPHPFFTTHQMRKLRHSEARSLCDAATPLPAAPSFPCRTDGDGFTFTVVSEFAYDSRRTVIQFLNEELLGAITSAFNRHWGQREAGTRLLFQRLHRDNITDLVKRELWGSPGGAPHCSHCPHHPVCPGLHVTTTGEAGGQQSRGMDPGQGGDESTPSFLSDSG